MKKFFLLIYISGIIGYLPAQSTISNKQFTDTINPGNMYHLPIVKSKYLYHDIWLQLYSENMYKFTYTEQKGHPSDLIEELLCLSYGHFSIINNDTLVLTDTLSKYNILLHSINNSLIPIKAFPFLENKELRLYRNEKHNRLEDYMIPPIQEKQSLSSNKKRRA